MAGSTGALAEMDLTSPNIRRGKRIPGSAASDGVMTGVTGSISGNRSGVGQLASAMTVSGGTGDGTILVEMMDTTGRGKVVGASSRGMTGLAGNRCPGSSRCCTVGQGRVTIDTV